MRHVYLALMVGVFACANANPDNGSLSISLSSVTVAVGQSVQVQATSDHPEAVTWDVVDASIATVTTGNAGAATVTGVATGHTQIVVGDDKDQRTIDVSVSAAAVDALTVMAPDDNVPAGLTVQLVALGHLTDGTVADVSEMVTWLTGNDQVATVDAHGRITAVSTGSTDISASISSIKGVATVAVSEAILESIDLGQTARLAKGLTLQLHAMGTYSDTMVHDISLSSAWSTTDPTVATVDATGLVRGLALGMATITCELGGMTTSLDVTVSDSVVVSIVVTPSSVSLPLGRTQQLVAMGTWSDGVTSDVTSSVAWSVAGGATVTVNAVGLVRAIAMGPSMVTAASGTATKSIDASVGPKEADHLGVSASAISIATNQLAPLHAAIVYSDGTSDDVTATATWKSSAPGTASCANGIITGVSAGPATITVKSGALSGTVAATVTGMACHVVINEVSTQNSSGADEWVELYNPCSAAFDVTGWTLVYRAAGTVTGGDSNTLQSLTGTMMPGDFRLYAGQDYPGDYDGTKFGTSPNGYLQRMNGGVAVRSGPASTGPIVDSLAYGTVTAGHPFLEGTAAPMLDTNWSVARLPFDGNDTNSNHNDFVIELAPTPRTANAP